MRRDGTNRMPVTVSTRRGRPCRLLRRSSYKDHDVVDDEVVQRGFIEAPVSLLTVPDRGYCGLLSISAPIDYAKRMWCRSTHHSTCEGETVLPARARTDDARGSIFRPVVRARSVALRTAIGAAAIAILGTGCGSVLDPRPARCACSRSHAVVLRRSRTPGQAVRRGPGPRRCSHRLRGRGVEPSCHPGDPAEWCGGAGPATDDRSGGHPPTSCWRRRGCGRSDLAIGRRDPRACARWPSASSSHPCPNGPACRPLLRSVGVPRGRPQNRPRGAPAKSPSAGARSLEGAPFG